jgi:energy-converting hydrogenase Eha subunit F
MTGDLLLMLFEQSRVKSKSPVAPFFKGGKSDGEKPKFKSYDGKLVLQIDSQSGAALVFIAPFAKGGGHREAMTGDLLLILLEQSRVKSKSPVAPFFKGGKSDGEKPKFKSYDGKLVLQIDSQSGAVLVFIAPFAKGGGHREAMTGDLLLILLEKSRVKSKSPVAPFFKGGKSDGETPGS